jgi:hypothetical protein
MEIGALARDRAGDYWQVNGDIRQVLNKSRVTTQLRKAMVRSEPVGVVTRQPTDVDRARVAVIIKPRRRVVMRPSPGTPGTV